MVKYKSRVYYSLRSLCYITTEHPIKQNVVASELCLFWDSHSLSASLLKWRMGKPWIGLALGLDQSRSARPHATGFHGYPDYGMKSQPMQCCTWGRRATETDHQCLNPILERQRASWRAKPNLHLGLAWDCRRRGGVSVQVLGLLLVSLPWETHLLTTWVQGGRDCLECPDSSEDVLSNQDQGLGLHPQLRVEDGGVGEGHAGLLAIGLHCFLLWVELVLNEEGVCFGYSVSIIC